MAGGEILVDVVAAAARVQGQVKADAVRNLSAGLDMDCPLGHSNASTAKFCGECGLPMGEMTIGERVDLGAVREALTPVASLPPEEQARKDAEHIEALAANAAMSRADQEPEITTIKDTSERKIIIHFVEDGFTWGGKVWQRGEMLAIGSSNPKWASAQAWILLSKRQQFERYGRIFFDQGPWPGGEMEPGTEVPLATASTSRWAAVRNGAPPARPDSEGTGALVPF